MLRFFAIEHGEHDGWQGHFVLATSPQDAADRYIKRIKNISFYKSEHYTGHTVEAKVYETEFDEFGVLQNIGASTFTDKPVLIVRVPD